MDVIYIGQLSLAREIRGHALSQFSSGFDEFLLYFWYGQILCKRKFETKGIWSIKNWPKIHNQHWSQTTLFIPNFTLILSRKIYSQFLVQYYLNWRRFQKHKNLPKYAGARGGQTTPYLTLKNLTKSTAHNIYDQILLW